MKLQNRSQIEALAKFKGQGDLVTSFYLDTDKGRLNKKEIQLALKNLVSEARDRACALAAAKDKTASLLGDLDLIAEHGGQAIASSNAAGLAFFSHSQKKFWHALELPHGPRNRITFDTNFYIRPLAAILDKYSPICALLISRRESRWYDISMNEIKALDELESDVPRTVREGGFEGTAAKRIERRLDAHLQEHFKRTAQRTFEISKKHPFDWLFIGCEDNNCGDFEAHLHSYLRDRVKARLKAHTGRRAGQGPPGGPGGRGPAQEGRGAGDRPQARRRDRARRARGVGPAGHDPPPEPVRGPVARRHAQLLEAGTALPDAQAVLSRRAPVPHLRQEDGRRPGRRRRGHRDRAQAGRDGHTSRVAVQARPLRRDRRLPQVQGLKKKGRAPAGEPARVVRSREPAFRPPLSFP